MEDKVIKEFPIGFWNTAPATKFGVEGVKDWYDFGTTFTMTGFYDLEPDKNKMLAILDECEKYNIKILFVDHRITFDKIHNADYKKILIELINDFGNHPAVYGFYLGDEPSEKYIDDAVETIRLFKEMCPDKIPYINLLPWVPWSVKDDPLLLAENRSNYKEKVIDFIRRSGIEIWGYDCYLQMQGRITEDKWIDAYFKNLMIHGEAAKETNTSLYYTTLATGHGGYRCPNQNEFRWEISTAVAHGARGIFYWFFYAEPYNFNYRLHPINQLNERTDTFRWLSSENRIFQMVYGSLFTELTLDKVYHIHKSYGGTPLLEEGSDEYIKEVRSYDENNKFTPAILSRFTRTNDLEKYYYALVNNSTEKCVYIYVKYAKPVEYFSIGAGWDKIQPIPNPEKWKNISMAQNAICKNTDEETVFCCSPGQIWVFAIGK